MNRLIIIGNGFDLAHGMQTRYGDFLFALLMKGFDISIKQQEYDCPLFYVRNTYFVSNEDYNNIKSIEDILQFDCSDNRFVYDYTISQNKQLMLDIMVKRGGSFSFLIKFPFLLKVLYSYTQNWVDIEQLYYDELKNILKGQTNNTDELKRLNTCFELIKLELDLYISSLPKVESLIKIRSRLFDYSGNNKNLPVKYEKQVILNFNYTPLINTYIHNFAWETKFEHIQIHGKANSVDNPIIFGYGDETDSEYAKMENTLNDGFLKYSKSFDYARNDAYIRLIDFITNDDFDVHIAGHSCGLSDRIMLKTIFEHQRCKKIQLFYYGTPQQNNFFDFQRSLSRHFSPSKKDDLRVKRVPLSDCIPLPQFNDPI